MKLTTKLFAIAGALVTIASTAQAQSFSDSTFNNADWGAINYQFGSATFTAQQTPTGGNPGSGREVTHVLGDGTAIGIVHLFIPINIFTGPGGISSVSYSLDCLAPQGQMGVGLALYQDESLYVADYTAVGGSSWQTKGATGLTESMFGLVDVSPSSVANMSINPDFDLVNSNISLGFFTANSGGPATISGSFDNFNVEVDAVPEPATMALLALPAIAAMRKRRQNG